MSLIWAFKGRKRSRRLTATCSVLLRVEDLYKRFGGIVALDGYNVRIRQGELVGLIGPNGAGKTTVFNLLSGVLTPTSGRIFINEQDITRQRPDENTILGIARTFQNIRLFKDLSVIDNIKIAFHMRFGKGFWSTIFHTPAYRQAEKEMELEANEFLDLFDLTSVRERTAKNLPYGIQRRVEIARAMATRPKLLLLDEPSAGLNPSETDELMNTLLKIHQAYDLTIFLVEHDMKLIMAICQKIQVIDRGRMLTFAPPDEVRRDQRVIEAYLGKSGRAKRHA
ncbi:MAG: ABC transporter ATP-binding protein [Deltaproteobacteria bacterium]|nr:ABC transporter ATP-binding protein [Deltaproteobacteria bacterium]